MDRSGGYSEEENVQLKIYSDQDTYVGVVFLIIIALVLLGMMWHDVYCISRVESLSIIVILIGGVFPVGHIHGPAMGVA